jgi:general secretion pathway protein K
MLVAGLVAIATAVVTTSANQRRLAQRSYEADARRELLDSALRVALVELASPSQSGPYWHPRQPRSVHIAGSTIEVSFERESGRIDLNTADSRFLIAAFVAMGEPEEQARANAARVRDWVDADETVSEAGGAERDEYRAAELPYEPRNGPFETVEELRQVVGLSEITDHQLETFTVYAQQREPAAVEAPPQVRNALMWLAKVAGEGGLNAALEPSSQLEITQPASYAGEVLRLRACLKDEGQTHCRTTIQRLTGNSKNPFQTFAWH